MNTFTLIFIIAICSVCFSLFFFLKSSSWSAVEGKMISFDVEEIYHSPNTVRSDAKGLFDYKLNIKYTYTFDGQEYTGDKLYAGLPNVTSDLSISEQLASEYSAGKMVDIYVNSKNPSESSLQTVKGLGTKGTVVLVLMFLLVVGLMIGGFYLMSKFDELD